MNINRINNTPVSQKPATTRAAKKREGAGEPKDKITVGKVAKGAGKVMLGTAMAAVVAPAKAAFKGSVASSKAALKGIEIGEKFKKDGIMKNIARAGLYAAPALGATAAVMAGCGPVGAVVAGLALPGAIGGTASAIDGAIGGAEKGLNIALNAGDKAEKAIGSRLGNIAGKTAKFATGIAAGLVGVPVGAALGGIHKGFTFAEKAIGIKKNPENLKDIGHNLAGETGLISGAALGVVGSGAGVASIIGGASSGAGSAATLIKGTGSAVEGFIDGTKRSFKAADKAVDELTK
ncbi:MAG: hypothetical protein ACLFQV_12140 [Vulcanimicrobiota bacterium]